MDVFFKGSLKFLRRLGARFHRKFIAIFQLLFCAWCDAGLNTWSIVIGFFLPKKRRENMFKNRISHGICDTCHKIQLTRIEKMCNENSKISKKEGNNMDALKGLKREIDLNLFILLSRAEAVEQFAQEIQVSMLIDDYNRAWEKLNRMRDVIRFMASTDCRKMDEAISRAIVTQKQKVGDGK